MKTIKNKLLLLSSVIAMSGCGSILSPVDQRQIVSYEISDSTLTTASHQACSKSRSQNVVYISPMRAYSPYDTLKMYYSNDKYQMNTFGYSQWVALPTDMLTQAMSKKIFDSCLFKNLVISNGLADANYRVIPLLVSLRQDINSGNNSAVVNMVIATELIDLNDNKVISSKVFNEQISTEVGPHGYVDGVNQLTTRFNNELISWLEQNT